jgi:hypothetical protein
VRADFIAADTKKTFTTETERENDEVGTMNDE